MFVLVLRIQEVLKNKGKDMSWLADEIGITRPSLYSRLKSAKIDTLKQISEIIDAPIQELIIPSKGYAHFYDEKGVWQGIRKL